MNNSILRTLGRLGCLPIIPHDYFENFDRLVEYWGRFGPSIRWTDPDDRIDDGHLNRFDRYFFDHCCVSRTPQLNRAIWMNTDGNPNGPVNSDRLKNNLLDGINQLLWYFQNKLSELHSMNVNIVFETRAELRRTLYDNNIDFGDEERDEVVIPMPEEALEELPLLSSASHSTYFQPAGGDRDEESPDEESERPAASSGWSFLNHFRWR